MLLGNMMIPNKFVFTLFTKTKHGNYASFLNEPLKMTGALQFEKNYSYCSSIFSKHIQNLL